MEQKNKKQTGKTQEDQNKTPASAEAEKDIKTDPDFAADDSGNADLDEGELAQKDNSND